MVIITPLSGVYSTAINGSISTTLVIHTVDGRNSPPIDREKVQYFFHQVSLYNRCFLGCNLAKKKRVEHESPPLSPTINRNDLLAVLSTPTSWPKKLSAVLSLEVSPRKP